MTHRQSSVDDAFEPSIGCRFKVEAAMLSMIEDLRRQGLSTAEIALSLADAAEDYVLRLASCADEDEAAAPHKPRGH
jgi:hypothetical protein